MSRNKKPFIWHQKTMVSVPIGFGKNRGFSFKNRNSPKWNTTGASKNYWNDVPAQLNQRF